MRIEGLKGILEITSGKNSTTEGGLSTFYREGVP
jgi:hypothetical protein